MTHAATKNIRNADGSVNVERAILAGHEARTDAFRGFIESARQMIKTQMSVAAERLLAQRHSNLAPHLTSGTASRRH